MFKNFFNRCPVHPSALEIEFLPSSEDVFNFVECPKPAKTSIPDWYKSSEIFDPNNLKFTGAEVHKPLKSCVPFLDSLTSGYTQHTWSDIVITASGDSVNYKWALPPQPLEHRSVPVSLPISKDYHNVELHWKMPWMIKVPKGYSVLITHPLNRLDLPFTSLSGIIDADEFHHVRFGNLPFYIKQNFTGIIPAGTPMFQIIPIKREVWKSSTAIYNQTDALKKEYSFGKKLFGEYKNIFWKKKKYE
jgi:hypothetical protein